MTDAEDENSLTISGTSVGLTTGTTVTVAVDGAGTDRTKTGTTDSSGNWSVSLSSAEVKALDASTPAAGGETITITASATDASNGTATFIYDPVAPTATLTPGSIGGNENGTNVYLGTGDKVTVNIAFSEGVSTAPTVQMKNDSANLGSAITATARSAYDSGSLTTSANQTKTPESAVLWDSVSEVGVITTKTASFGGTLLETQSPLASLRLRVTIPSQGNYQTLRYKDGSEPIVVDRWYCCYAGWRVVERSHL